MTTLIIGYGPPLEVCPHVPEFIILQTDNGIIKLSQKQESTNLTPKTLDDLVASAKVSLFNESVEHNQDEWIAIECYETDNVILSRFGASVIREWSVERASKMVEESLSISKREPLKAIAVLQNAAKLCGIELNKLIQNLELKRQNPSEKLEDIMLRLKLDLSKN